MVQSRGHGCSRGRTIPHRSRHINYDISEMQILEIFNILKIVNNMINKNN